MRGTLESAPAKVLSYMVCVKQVCVFALLVMSLSCSRETTAPKHAKEPAGLDLRLRDFSIEEKKEEATTTYKATGTLVAVNSRFREKTIVVWLSSVNTADSSAQKPSTQVVLLRDGVGHVEELEFFWSGGDKPTKPKYKWTVLGWAELNRDATLTLE